MFFAHVHRARVYKLLRSIALYTYSKRVWATSSPCGGWWKTLFTTNENINISMTSCGLVHRFSHAFFRMSDVPHHVTSSSPASPQLWGSATARSTSISQKPCHWIIPGWRICGWAPTASYAWSVAGSPTAGWRSCGSWRSSARATASGPWPAWRALLGRSITFSEVFFFLLILNRWCFWLNSGTAGWFERSILF